MKQEVPYGDQAVPLQDQPRTSRRSQVWSGKVRIGYIDIQGDFQDKMSHLGNISKELQLDVLLMI